MSLERLEHIEDKNMLAGNILVLFERDDCYDTAQELFVRAGRPREALQMRVDLKHWDEATRLAKAHDPSQLDDTNVEGGYEIQDGESPAGTAARQDGPGY